MRMLEPGSTLFGRFELGQSRELPPSGAELAAKLLTFDGVDRLTQEPVVIKAFPLPDDPTLALLASALWDREVRAAHLATSSPRGKALLKLLDARKDVENSALVIVSEGTPTSLSDELRSKPLPEFLRVSGRALLWPALVDLAEGIQALHSAGLIHRAISPATVFVGHAQDRPLLLLGDFSWAVYLHGISKMASEPQEEEAPERGKHLTQYTPPEGRMSEGARAESYRSDMFSFGVLVAECLLGKVSSRDPEDREWLTKFRQSVFEAPVLDQKEIFLLHRLLDPNPSRRPSAAETVDLMRAIASDATHTVPPPPKGALTVAMDLRPQSKLWGDLGKWMSIDGLGNNPAEFLEREFTGAPVFVRGDRPCELLARGNSGTPYSLIPYHDKKALRDNDTVAAVWPIPYMPSLDSPAVLVLDGGVKVTVFGWQTPTGPTWAPYFALARSRDTVTTSEGPREQFVARLRLTLEAEKELLSRAIYAYRVTRPTEFEENHRVLEIQLDPNAPDPEYDTRARPTVESWFRTQFADEVPEVELSELAHPEAKMQSRRKWRIQALLGENRLLLESPRSGDPPPQAGWVRPWNLRFLLPLLARKRKVVDQVEYDEYLLDAVTAPGSVTIFHGTKKEDDLVSEILGVRPLFLIQGPPGTGKTYWASRVVEALLRQDGTARILVSAQAHKPLDHLMDRVQLSLKSLGLDTPPILLRLSPKFERPDSDDVGRPNDLDQVTRDVLGRASQWFPRFVEWEPIATEWRELANSQINDPSPAWERLLQGSANVVFVTSTSSALRELEHSAPFDFVIIEEAGKAYAPELLPPMRLGRRWLLIGDQQQLPPFQHHEMITAVRRRLERDQDFKDMDDRRRSAFAEALDGELRFFGYLFERAKQGPYPFKPRTSDVPARRLSEQWRMPGLLSEFISTIFYGDKFVIRSPSRPPPFRFPPFLRESPLIWIATPPCASTDRRAEEREARGGGYTNPYEAKLVDQLLRYAGPGPLPAERSLVVLSPYAAQVALLKRALSNGYRNLPNFRPDVDVHTVDSFQGREADVVIVSLVRNNDRERLQSALGFLTQEERMNVLLSRASSQLIVVGCLAMLETFASSPEVGRIGKVPEFVRRRGLVTPAGALMDRGSR
jgi:hypothetical protein